MKKGDNIGAIRMMIEYCKKTHERLASFDHDEDEFYTNPVFQDSCAINIMHIGEYVQYLSGDFEKIFLTAM